LVAGTQDLAHLDVGIGLVEELDRPLGVGRLGAAVPDDLSLLPGGGKDLALPLGQGSLELLRRGGGIGRRRRRGGSAPLRQRHLGRQRDDAHERQHTQDSPCFHHVHRGLPPFETASLTAIASALRGQTRTARGDTDSRARVSWASRGSSGPLARTVSPPRPTTYSTWPPT